LIYSDDFGETWQLGARSLPEEVSFYMNETVVTELNDGRLYIVSRNAAGDPDKVKSINISMDGGASFAGLFEETDMFPGPVVQGALLTFNDDLLLFSSPQNSSQRRKMGIVASDDQGQTWYQLQTVTEKPAAYSDMAKLDDVSIGLLFEYWNSLIPYWSIVYRRVATH
ncbi:MAG: glycoside hydrolase, partial [Pseudomonadales bacterium]|nr:glycoside hydrolase [Pseudomonadales bacterium]